MLLLCWLLLLLPPRSQGQQYKFDVYGPAQGLGNVAVQDLAFDRQGFLWIATQNGVYRLLGTRLDRFGPDQGLKDPAVSGIYVDQQGRVWATADGSLYLLREDRFSRIGGPTDHIGVGSQILGLDSKRLLIINQKQLFVVELGITGNVISSSLVFSADQQKEHPELNALSMIVMGKDGTIWLGCGTELCSYREGSLRVWGPEAGVPSQTWKTLHEDRQGSIWAVSKTALLQLRRGSTAFEDRKPPNMDAAQFFLFAALLEDRGGRILLASGTGLERWDGVSWQSIGSANGLITNRVTSLAIDVNGDPWIGTFGGGLSHWTGYEHLEAWTQLQGLPSSIIWAIDNTEPDQTLIGTKQGPALLIKKKRQITSLTGGRPWPYAQVCGIVRDKRGRIWIATTAGSILRIDPKSLEIKSIAELSTYINRVFLSPDGKAWIFSSKGLHVVNTQDLKPVVRHVSEADGILEGKYMFASASVVPGGDAKNDLWFSTGRSLVRYSAGIWSKLEISGLDIGHAGLKEIGVQPDGTIWVAGQDDAGYPAIWHLKPNETGMRAVRLELPVNFQRLLIFSFLIDSRGWLWFGTDGGLLSWNRADWRIFDQETGFVWNDSVSGVISEAPDGSIWVGTSGGLAHLFNPETAFNSVSLPVAIVSVQRGADIYMPEAIPTLPWASTNLRFRFASSNTWNQSSQSYSYRLLGLDSSWVTTRSPQAEFVSLPPGKYRFQVLTTNPDLGAISAIAESAFEILPPWWKTIWFYGLCTAAGCFMIWLLASMWTRKLRFRKQELERRLQEMQVETNRLAKRAQDAALAEERNRLALELHDTLAGAFTGIYMQLQAASGRSNPADDRRTVCIGRAEELARTGLRQVREFVHNLVIGADETEFTLDAIGRLVTSATDGTSIMGQYAIQGIERPIRASHLHALFRITQESVNNAQRYAEATKIQVKLDFKADAVNLIIRDDGKGFNAEQPSDVGFGIAGMRQRTIRLGGRFEIESAPGFGTEICVELPYPYPEEKQMD